MHKYAHQLWSKLEEQIRREPTKAVLLALAGGFFLCLLPIGRLTGALVRVTLVLLRPALLVLGVIKLLEYSGVTCEPHRDSKFGG
jgi:uncharacterized protein YacL